MDISTREFCVHGIVVHLRLGNCIGYSLRALVSPLASTTDLTGKLGVPALGSRGSWYGLRRTQRRGYASG